MFFQAHCCCTFVVGYVRLGVLVATTSTSLVLPRIGAVQTYTITLCVFCVQSRQESFHLSAAPTTPTQALLMYLGFVGYGSAGSVTLY